MDLKDYQIYLLKIMAQPADIQINEYEWDDDLVPLSIFGNWAIRFTGHYYSTFDGYDDSLLPGFDDDIVEIEKKRLSVLGLKDMDFWSNESLEKHPFWIDIRRRSREALERRGILIDRPDPDDWYRLLPEELQ